MLKPTTAEVFWKRTRWQANSGNVLMQTQLLQQMIRSVWLPVGATLGSEFCTLCRAESSVKNISLSLFGICFSMWSVLLVVFGLAYAAWFNLDQFSLVCVLFCAQFCTAVLLVSWTAGCPLAWRVRTCWCVAAELRWSTTKNGVRSGWKERSGVEFGGTYNSVDTFWRDF